MLTIICSTVFTVSGAVCRWHTAPTEKKCRPAGRVKNPAAWLRDFWLNRKIRFLVNKNTPLWVRTRAELEFVAKAAAPGARVLRAELFVFGK